MFTTLRKSTLMLAFYCSYVLLAVFVLRFFTQNHVVAIFWPPSGMALAAILLGGFKYVPLVFVGALTANILTGSPSLPATLFAVCNVGEALLGCLLLKRWAKFDPGLSTAYDYFKLVVFGAFVAPIPSALAGATALQLLASPAQTWFNNFGFWWMGDSLGIQVFAPLLLIWRRVPGNWFKMEKVAEALVGLALTFIAGQIVFFEWFSYLFLPYAKVYLMFVFVLWAAVRFGRHATLLIVGMILVQALGSAIAGLGFFSGGTTEIRLINIWLFLAILSIVSMALATFVNERKQSLVALAANADLLERTGLIAKVGGWEVDVIQKKFTLSREALRIVEIDPQAEVSMDQAFTLIEPQYRAAHAARVETAIAHHTPWDVEFGMMTAKGRNIWVRSQGSAHAENGIVTKLVGTIHDITEKLQADIALKQSEERLRTIFKTLSEGVALNEVLYDKDGRIIDNKVVMVNDAYYHIADYDKSLPVIGTLATRLYNLDPEFAAIYMRSLQTATETTHVEMQSTISKKFFEIRTSPVVNNLFVTTFIDITRRKTSENRLRESETRFRALVESSMDAIVVHQSGFIAYANPAAMRLFRAGNNDLIIGRNVLDFVPAEYRLLVIERMQLTNKIGGHAPSVEERMLRLDGTIMDVEVSAAGMLYNEKISTMVTIRDIGERKAAENRLRASEDKLRSLIAAMTDVILILDADGCYLEIAPTRTDLLYRPTTEMLGKTLHDVFPKAQADHFLQYIRSTLAANETQEVQYDLDIKGQKAWFAAKISKLSEQTVVLVARDITESKLTEDRIRYLGHHDLLTALPNRALFEDRLAQTLALAEAHSFGFALLFLDVDHFKKINDSLGHIYGDLFLKEVAARLLNCVQKIDTVSRQGGDEFIVLLSETPQAEDAAAVAQRICATMLEPFILGQKQIMASVSIGITVYPRDGISADALMQHADIAMYHAKKSGRNQFQYFSEELNRSIHERLEIESALREAIGLGQLEVYYQPQQSLHSEKIESCEALLRWHHPQWGMVPPAKFIPVAEETGQIFDIGKWVLQSVATRLGDLKAAGHEELRISVNVSAEQLRNPDFSGLVTEIISKYNIAPGRLELEVTESMFMHDTQKSAVLIERLSELGVLFSIDDFGTGYSSLSYLRDLKIHFLKIDQSFVRTMTLNAENAAIVRTIIGLTHNLNLLAIAEGVETAAERDFLKAEGCDLMQGYFLAKPMPFAELVQFLKSGLS